jgi:N-acetylglutamate synthase-like GNAT family acetyltransferase
VLTVRRAEASDVPALADLAREAYEIYVPRIGRAPAPVNADYAEAVRTGLTWAAVRDGVIVGLLVLVVLPDHLLLENVAVLPSAQGSGVGARLLAFAEEQARELGREKIRLYTNEAMTENLVYYPKHGYVETHRAEQDGFRRVFFEKRITGR